MIYSECLMFNNKNIQLINKQKGRALASIRAHDSAKRRVTLLSRWKHQNAEAAPWEERGHKNSSLNFFNDILLPAIGSKFPFLCGFCLSSSFYFSEMWLIFPGIWCVSLCYYNTKNKGSQRTYSYHIQSKFSYFCPGGQKLRPNPYCRRSMEIPLKPQKGGGKEITCGMA